MKRILLTLLIAFATLPRLSAAVGDNFTYEGLVYTILDEDAKTCKTKDGRKIDGLDGYDSCGNYVTGDLVIAILLNSISAILCFYMGTFWIFG